MSSARYVFCSFVKKIKVDAETGYIVAQYKTTMSGKELYFSAINERLPTTPGLKIALYGTWHTSPEGGQALTVLRSICNVTYLNNVKRYLMSLHDSIDENTALQIINAHPYDLWDQLKDQYEPFNDILAIDYDVLRDKYRRTVAIRQLIILFEDMRACPYSLICRIVDQYGSAAKKAVIDNPYLLCDFGVNFLDVDHFAAEIGFD